jgi:hypothetical protein
MTLSVYYGLALWGGLILLFCFGLTAMISRYAKRQPGDAHGMPWISKVFPHTNVCAFDIYFWCGVIALFSAVWLGLASLA